MAPSQASPETDNGSGVHDRNRRLRHSYLELEALAADADRAGDDGAARRARARMKSIADRFVSLNANLVGPVARKFRTTDSRASWEDYDAAGMYGLWEAFTKWDPDRRAFNRRTNRETHVTFGTFSRPYIEGRINREVAKAEHGQISYHDFTERAKLREVEEELSKDGAHTPSHAEVAEAAAAKLGRNVTVDQVERTRRSRPASLDKKVGGTEDGATLGELLADRMADVTDIADVQRDTALATLVTELDALGLFLLLRRDELDGAESQSMNQIAALTGLGREVLRRRYNTARAALEAAVATDQVAPVPAGHTRLPVA